jgi:hypothetical protein
LDCTFDLWFLKDAKPVPSGPRCAGRFFGAALAEAIRPGAPAVVKPEKKPKAPKAVSRRRRYPNLDSLTKRMPRRIDLRNEVAHCAKVIDQLYNVTQDDSEFSKDEWKRIMRTTGEAAVPTNTPESVQNQALVRLKDLLATA